MYTSDLTQQYLERSKSVVGNADFLSMAVTNQDQSQIEDAFDDLLASYDHYAGKADSNPARLNFDEVASLETPEERDQSVANALASSLLDLEMAVLLSQAAQAVGELEGEIASAELDKSVVSLNETINALQGVAAGSPGTTRLAFDQVLAASPGQTLASPDIATAKATYKKQTEEVYNMLLSESTVLLMDMFKQLSGLDEKQIKEGLTAVKGGLDVPSTGKAIPRMLDALGRAVKTVKDLIGEAGFKKIDEEVSKLVAEIKKGEGALSAFLKYSYKSDEGQKTIFAWADASQSDLPTIDGGARRLANLQQQAVQTFTLSKKIVANLRLLSSPIKWLLKKFSGSVPVDIILAGLFFLVADATLLRAMDYADTTTLVKFVDGTLIISRQSLGVPS